MRASGWDAVALRLGSVVVVGSCGGGGGAGGHLMVSMAGSVEKKFVGKRGGER